MPIKWVLSTELRFCALLFGGISLSNRDLSWGFLFISLLDSFSLLLRYFFNELLIDWFASLHLFTQRHNLKHCLDRFIIKIFFRSCLSIWRSILPLNSKLISCDGPFICSSLCFYNHAHQIVKDINSSQSLWGNNSNWMISASTISAFLLALLINW